MTDDGVKADAQILVDAMMPFAAQRLVKAGTFLPYGAEIVGEGEIVLVSPNLPGRPDANEVLDSVRSSLRESLGMRRVRAVAVAYDARIRMEKDVVDAVTVQFEHASGVSHDVHFPYEVVDGQVRWKEPIKVSGMRRVFSK